MSILSHTTSIDLSISATESRATSERTGALPRPERGLADEREHPRARRLPEERGHGERADGKDLHQAEMPILRTRQQFPGRGELSAEWAGPPSRWLKIIQ
ncbi:hypothetical protein WMF45_22770 [Sorangium sp. So ce448]|uniref:hypothetical protein n=1 Tax=Sorangium sp. So ce448 TaxID=3133314 RepID=UPI003F5F7F2A